ncbi:MAG: glycosyltransferase family 9 protein [Planctomycetes bacterium]|nr:glycosyltransferase family 9 protein [Planctomycetota bacterium]
MSKVIASNERIDYNHFLMSKEYRKILIIKPSALGDIALALPVLAAMRRNFSDAKISWLIRPEFAGLLEGHEYIEELIPFDRKFLGKSWYNPKAFAALIRLILKLRREKFDAVADLQGLFRTGFLSWVSGMNRSCEDTGKHTSVQCRDESFKALKRSNHPIPYLCWMKLTRWQA